MNTRKLIVFAVCISLQAGFWSCDSSDKEEPTPEPSAETDEAAGSFTSDESGTVETPGGARITVPEGAVPRQANGDPGTSFFSIATDDDFEITPPEGEMMASRVYRLGPAGFTFARPVTVELPILEGIADEVSLYRVNPATGDYEYFAGSYDLDRGTVRAQAYELSVWFLSCRPVEDIYGPGCLWVTNQMPSAFVYICVQDYELAYPERDAAWAPAGGWWSLWGPAGNIGVATEGEMWLPQGWYTFCVQVEDDVLGFRNWTFHDTIRITAPAHPNWGIVNYSCSDNLTVTGIPVPSDSGRCDCSPTPSTPLGNGEFLVTLTWSNPQPVDLNLAVREPDNSLSWWLGFVTPNGTTMDFNNNCHSYINGHPENIYSTQTPISGEYIVTVAWGQPCWNYIYTQDYEVKVTVQGVTQTYSRTATVEEYTDPVEVARFTYPGGSPVSGAGRAIED